MSNFEPCVLQASSGGPGPSASAVAKVALWLRGHRGGQQPLVQVEFDPATTVAAAKAMIMVSAGMLLGDGASNLTGACRWGRAEKKT